MLITFALALLPLAGRRVCRGSSAGQACSPLALIDTLAQSVRRD
jgi:hypothetical protein